MTDAHAAVILAATEAAKTDATAALSDLAGLRHLVDNLTGDYVRRARSEGRSWSQIGECLGITAQAAHKRFRNLG